MAPEVIAALIASVTSLILSAVQLMRQRKDTKELESFKHQLETERLSQTEYLRAYLEARIEGSEQKFQSYREILQRVQTLRDKVRSVLEYPDGYDEKILREEIEAITSAILSSYAENQTNLPQTDLALAHGLKNNCRSLGVALLGWRHARSGADDMEGLLRLADEVAAQQSALRQRAVQEANEFSASLQTRVERKLLNEPV